MIYQNELINHKKLCCLDGQWMKCVWTDGSTDSRQPSVESVYSCALFNRNPTTVHEMRRRRFIFIAHQTVVHMVKSGSDLLYFCLVLFWLKRFFFFLTFQQEKQWIETFGHFDSKTVFHFLCGFFFFFWNSYVNYRKPPNKTTHQHIHTNYVILIWGFFFLS